MEEIKLASVKFKSAGKIYYFSTNLKLKKIYNMNCGNFLNSTDAKSCGVEVGYGKLYLIYAEKQTVNVSSLNATAINAAIGAGTIIGVLKDWDEVAGAPVAEVTAERSGSKKIRFISDII